MAQESPEREWVRNHRSSGYIAGRFAGEFKGQPREMLIIQTFKGVVVVPERSTIPITKEDMIRQAALDLEPIIASMLEGGFTLDDIAAAWNRAMDYQREVGAKHEAAGT
jgi:hypothetical protein